VHGGVEGSSKKEGKYKSDQPNPELLNKGMVPNYLRSVEVSGWRKCCQIFHKKFKSKSGWVKEVKIILQRCCVIKQKDDTIKKFTNQNQAVY
jgi:hypothetical protein